MNLRRARLASCVVYLCFDGYCNYFGFGLMAANRKVVYPVDNKILVSEKFPVISRKLKVALNSLNIYFNLALNRKLVSPLETVGDYSNHIHCQTYTIILTSNYSRFQRTGQGFDGLADGALDSRIVSHVSCHSECEVDATSQHALGYFERGLGFSGLE